MSNKFLKINFLISLSLIFILGFNNLFAQKPLRIEIDADKFDNVVFVSLKKSGLLAIKQIDTKGSKNDWEVEKLNTNLKREWKTIINLNKNLRPFSYEIMNDTSLQLIFTSSSLRDGISHYKINLNNGKYQTFQYFYDKRVDVSNIDAIGNTLFAAAYLKPSTIAGIGQFFYSLTLIPLFTGNKINKSEPRVYIANKKSDIKKTVNFKLEEKSKIIASNIDTNRNLYCVLINESSRKVNKLIYYEFNTQGEMVTKAELNNIDVNILSTYIVFSENNEVFILGSYNYKNSKNNTQGEQPLGILFSKIEGQSFKVFKKHKFSDFNNTIKILSEKGMIKVKNNKVKNDYVNIRINWIPHREVRYVDSNFIVSGEIYYTDYQPEYQRRGGYDIYGNYRYFSYWEETFDGYVFTDAVIAAFNTKGELVWDNHMYIEDLKKYQLEQNVVNYTEDGNTILMYYNQDAIFMKVINGNETVKNETENKINLLGSSQLVLSNQNTNITHWYNSYFLLTGYQKIKNSRNEKRRVFFINKIAFE